VRPPPERAEVWSALSALYLDTEHDEGALRWVAARLARSPYTVAELREIDVWEVAPVVLANVYVVAGAWAGFDERWLRRECGRRWARPRWVRRVAAALGWRRVVRRTSAFYWARLEPLIDAERGASGGGPSAGSPAAPPGVA
jgi:hypothetical protein